MKIYLPHINYTLHVKDISKGKGEVKEYLKTKVACHIKINECMSEIYVKLPIKQKDVTTLCHELIHVLQNISHTFDINFSNEEEHFAYMFQYMLNKILGYEYE